MTDRHDPDLRAKLHVEPLDEVTRARLVRTALAAAPVASDRTSDRGRRRAGWLAAAAAMVAVIVVGVGVLVGDSEPPQTTASAPTTDALADKGVTQELEAAAAPSANREFSGAAPSLGSLGEVGRAAQLRAAVETKKTSEQFQAACPVPDIGAPGTLISGGNGTVDGEPASVYVIEVPGTGKVAVAVVNQGCRIALRASL